ncbi:MAG TPA: hypothetical protein VH682_24985 [Gemmataceae bacterium]|jgi:hypothetical protein
MSENRITAGSMLNGRVARGDEAVDQDTRREDVRGATDSSTAESQARPVPTISSSDYPTPHSILDTEELVWDEDAQPIDNYRALGQRLAAAGDIYRRPEYASGLLLAAAGCPNIAPVIIDKGNRLAAVIADRIRLRVLKEGKTRGHCISASHLNTMLLSEAFLQQFRPVDDVVRVAHYLPDYTLLRPGYNDGGPGQRLLYVGSEPKIEHSLDAINAFLDVMEFATLADRSNAVAAALTVLLRNFWPGAKPINLVTASKSHAGKDTVILFACGHTPHVSVSYQTTDWALERSCVGALRHSPNTGVLIVENARLDQGNKRIASGFLERLVTDPEPFYFSTGTGGPTRTTNHLVLAISTNYGTVSEDLLNRGLPINLEPKGNIADRKSPIGNPKLEYLPQNQERIEAELHGMIARWVAAGRPIDRDAKHSFSQWAQVIGGILKVSNFGHFLANNLMRKTADDPLRRRWVFSALPDPTSGSEPMTGPI